MKKLFVLLLVNVVMLSGCGESEQEKANYEAIESEAKDFSRPGGPGTLDDGTEAERERQRKLKDEQKAADEAAVKKATEETPAEHPAITVANQVLAATRTGQAAHLRPLLNAANQKKLSYDDIVGQLDGLRAQIGGVAQVTELRKWQREGEVAAKIRVEAELVVWVVVLTLEEGQYRFKHLTTPTIAAYDSLEKIAP